MIYLNKVSLPISPFLSPLPVVLVSCGDIDGRKNIITLAWVATLASEPPVIGIGVRPTRYSWGLIQRYGSFVVNLPDASQTEKLKYCGSVSGRNENKFENAGFRAIRGDVVRTPLIAECPVNIECRVKDRISLGSHDLFLGETVAVHAEKGVVTGGGLDFQKFSPVSYFQGKFVALGEEIV